MTDLAILAISGTASTVALTNVRQGAPSTSAPVVRKLAAGSPVPFIGIAIGETVQRNAHWFQLAGNAFVWAGACNLGASEVPPVPAAPSPAPPPAPPPPAQEILFPGYGLDTQFAARLSELFARCKQKGLDFRISQGLRTPQVQASYYCRWNGRTVAQIDKAIAKLRAAGADWIADIMTEYRAIPKTPRWLTNAMPGAGWHQWGEAADCYCYRNGKMVESGSDPCYKTYADLARELGLTAGYYFKSQDSGHVQLRPEGGASDVYSWPEIDRVMQERFGDKPSTT